MRRAAIVAAALLAAVRAPAGEAEYGRAVRSASRPAATPFAHGALPGWRTADSAPLRAFPEGLRPVEYVESTDGQYVDTGASVTAQTRIEARWTQTGTAKQQRLFGVNDGGGATFALYVNNNGAWAVNTGTSSGGAMQTVVPGMTYDGSFDLSSGLCTINGTSRQNGGTPFSSTNTIPIFTRRNAGTAMTDYPAQMRLHWFRVYHGSVLVRDFRPAVDADGVACLLDLVEGRPYYSATETPLVAGPLFRPATPASLAAARRNWYAGALLATNAPLPVVSGGLAVFDTVIIPEGLYATRRDAGEILVADSDAISALVARYRARLAPTNVPVFVEHDRSRPAGRVTALWRVAGEGVCARVEASEAIVRESGRRWHASAELRVLRAAANDGMGTWADFCLPWAVTGLALTEDPALDTPIITGAMLDAPKSPYPGIVPGGKCR